MTPTAPGGGPAIPVYEAADDARVSGGPVIPVYGYVGTPTDGRRLQGGAAMPVRVLTAADLQQNGGRYRLEGRPVAMPIYAARTGQGRMGGPAQLVYPISPWSFYAAKVAAIASSNLIAYWPLWEASGTVATDIGGSALNGAYTGVTLGQQGIGDGRTSPLFDGANDYCNIYSAALAAAFNGAEGTFVSWFKVANAGVWTDGAFHSICRLQADASNQIVIDKSSTNNVLRMIYTAGGTQKISTPSNSSTGFLCVAMTWSKSADQMIPYVNGVATQAALTGLGVWAGALAATTTTLGASSTVPALVWSGYLAHFVLCNAALPQPSIAQLATV